MPTAPVSSGAVGVNLFAEMGDLVAGDSGLRLFGVSGTIAVFMAMGVATAIPVCRRNLDWFHGSAGNSHLDLLDRPDLHDRFRGLLQHQLFVDFADLGGLFKSLFAARAIFFGCGERNIVLQVTD